jgi:hypothetical protein
MTELVIPGLADFARSGRPAPAQEDDGNQWVDGLCWLYCGQRWTRVLWIGPVSIAGAEAPAFACGPCITVLNELLWTSLLLGDEPEPPEAAPVRPTERGQSGRHRGRTRTWFTTTNPRVRRL